MKATICFLGGGNMATSMVAGLISDGVDPSYIIVVDRNAPKRDYLERTYRIKTSDDANASIAQSDIVILAVKPQVMDVLAADIRDSLKRKSPLVISVAAGIPLGQYAQWFGDKVAVVRAMPNTPSMIRRGATGLCANDQVSKQQREMAEHIMRTAGVVVWVDNDHLIDVVAAASGSGPAYFFALMEHMIDSAVNMGLTHKQAKLLVMQTALGAAAMAFESSDDIPVLREKITSKGGATAAALQSFANDKFDEIVDRAMHANLTRSQDLATIFQQSLTQDKGEA